MNLTSPTKIQLLKCMFLVLQLFDLKLDKTALLKVLPPPNDVGVYLSSKDHLRNIDCKNCHFANMPIASPSEVSVSQ